MRRDAEVRLEKDSLMLQTNPYFSKGLPVGENKKAHLTLQALGLKFRRGKAMVGDNEAGSRDNRRSL